MWRKRRSDKGEEEGEWERRGEWGTDGEEEREGERGEGRGGARRGNWRLKEGKEEAKGAGNMLREGP